MSPNHAVRRCGVCRRLAHQRRLRGRPQELHLIYPQGNGIAASPQTPYLQTGETKYGKPMLDRVTDHPLSLSDAARVALVSLDATMRSNITVGPPFELAILERDTFKLGRQLNLRPSNRVFRQLQKRWQEGLERALTRLPRFDWGHDADDG